MGNIMNDEVFHMARQQKRKKKWGLPRLLLYLPIAFLSILAASRVFHPSIVTVEISEQCTAFPKTDSIDKEFVIPETNVTPIEQQEQIRILAVGDNLMHMGIVKSGLQEDGSYNFDLLYSSILPYLNQADIKIINQETILGGDQLGYSGYPHFNSPSALCAAINKAGFNVALQASNHSADMGIDGIKSCVSYWNRYPNVHMLGIRDALPENPVHCIDYDHNAALFQYGEKTVAVLNYTYGPNMGIIPKGLRGYMNILCAYNEVSGQIDYHTINPNVLTDIEEMDRLADFVIVCPHWGNEYEMIPSKDQRNFALQMTESGADLIIGSHPHVVQPVEWITSSNGRKSLCFYSLGNYVSTQKMEQNILEAMAYVTIDLTTDPVSIVAEKSGALPIVCQYTPSPVRFHSIYPLEDYTDELAAEHGIIYYGKTHLHRQKLIEWAESAFGEFLLSKDTILKP